MSLVLLFLYQDPMSAIADRFRVAMLFTGLCGFPACLSAGVALLSNPRLRARWTVRLALGGAVLYQVGLIGVLLVMLAYAPLAARW